MIYECQGGHISFTKDYLNACGMRGCNRSTVMISLIDIKWFYKISKKGLSIDRKDLHMIIEDPNMSREVKKEITKIFQHLSY
jgi:ABC-type dipeptide/oligopeptide/nickel transport system ATPase component